MNLVKHGRNLLFGMGGKPKHSIPFTSLRSVDIGIVNRKNEKVEAQAKRKKL